MAFLNPQFDNLIKYELEEVYIAGKRHYVSPNTGEKYPSVTTLLSGLSKDGIDAWKKRIGEEKAKRISYQASSLGTALHNVCESYIREGCVPPKTMPNIKQRFADMRPVIDDRIGDVYALETPLYSDRLRIAGRTDVIGLFDGILSVIDFKTSAKWKKPEWVTSYWYQTAIYAMMMAERTRGSCIPTQLVLLISVEGENQPQIMIEPAKNWIPKALDYVREFHAGINIQNHLEII